MTIQLVFFAVAGLMVTLFGLAMAFFEYYIDAKIDPLTHNVDTLVQYMISHEGKISMLQERTKRLQTGSPRRPSVERISSSWQSRHP